MSPTNRPRPVTSGGSSSRATERPRTPPEGLSLPDALITDSGRNTDETAFPAKAGTHPSGDRTVEEWIPAFAGIAVYGFGPKNAVSFARLARFGEGGAHRGKDPLVAGAAAEVGRQDLEQFLVADVGLLLQDSSREHEEPRRAKAALHAVM